MRVLNLLFSFLVIFTSNSAIAFEGYDECKVFEESITELASELPVDELFPWQEAENFGFDFDYYDDEKVPWDIKRIYGKTREKYDYDYDDWEIVKSGIFKINDNYQDEISEEFWQESLTKDSIELTFLGGEKKYQFTKSKFKIIDIAVNPVITDIYDIDVKRDEFSAVMTLNTWYLDGRFLNIAKKIYEEGVKRDPTYIKSVEADEDLEFGFACKFDQDFVDRLDLEFPSVSINGFRPTSNIRKPVYQFEYRPETAEAGLLHDTVQSYSDKVEQIIDGGEFFIVWKEEDFTGHFRNSFDLKKYPFDRQYLNMEIIPNPQDFNSVDGVYRLSLGLYGQEVLDSRYMFQLNSEWEFQGYDQRDTQIFNDLLGEFTPSLEFYFKLERNSEYYLYKLLIPIMLLLALTWSIFWIEISELETRVTISIVTFLALIAYNFVIDSDLAKLSYLTFLDLFIIVSYVFAGTPTFVAIICKRFMLSGTVSIAEGINFVAKVIFPVGYLVTIGFIMFAFEVSIFEG